jgi:chromate transport protein ChrA
MGDKYKFIIIKILKISAIIFLISAVGSFITSLIYNIINSSENIENLVIFILANLSVTLFYRIVMAVFFFVFAMFIEEWLKTDDKEE